MKTNEELNENELKRVVSGASLLDEKLLQKHERNIVMTEKEFLDVVIKMVRKGNHHNKTRILELLSRSKLTCDKTSEFTRRKWNHFCEYIYITYRMDIWSLYKNIMHDKFCIIDFQVAIHGTFNWTDAANYNKETISIDRNPATARTFADEFMRLKRSCLSEKSFDF